LRAAIERAIEAAIRRESTAVAATELGTTGFVMHTIPFATFCFVRDADDPVAAIRSAIRAGGDTDSIGAIVGAWSGALHGAHALPADLISQLHDGPFGPTHLRALAARLADGSMPPARYSWPFAMFRNLALFPVVLAHGVRRLLPV
jgi:ADP-ribosylglycohydrolase